MNPFDLPGPLFLLFYAVFATSSIAGLVFLRRFVESGEPPHLDRMDPYLIAHLRGGEPEAIRTAMVSLLDRGLLTEDGELLRAKADSIQTAKAPIERAILLCFEAPAGRSRAFDAAQKPMMEAARLGNDLIVKRLLPSNAQIMNRVVVGVVLALLLVWIATTKLDIALARGRENVFLLSPLSALCAIAVLFVLYGRRTLLGDRVFSDLQELFAGLHARARHIAMGGATNELALLVAVFGVEALPTNVGFDRRALYPPPLNRGNNSGGCGSGSDVSISCGSGCGSAGGSGCGGGGGGGGCGGCGS